MSEKEHLTADMVNPPWMPAEEVRDAFHRMRNMFNDLRLDNERLNIRTGTMEKELRAQTERAEKAETSLDQVLKELAEIKTSIKIANLLAKFVAWCSGIILGVAGIWYSRHG